MDLLETVFKNHLTYLHIPQFSQHLDLSEVYRRARYYIELWENAKSSGNSLPCEVVETELEKIVDWIAKIGDGLVGFEKWSELVKKIRGDFPDVSQLVATKSGLYIFDISHPHFSKLWMIFEVGKGNIIESEPLTVNAKNAVIKLVSETGSVCLIDFIEDTAFKVAKKKIERYNGNVSERNLGKGYSSIQQLPESIRQWGY